GLDFASTVGDRLFQAGPDLDDSRRIAETRERRTKLPATRDGLFSLVFGSGFLVLATALPVALHSSRSASVPLVLLLVLSYALAGRIEFEIGAGSAVPTQLVLVPMLFLLPLGLVPV